MSSVTNLPSLLDRVKAPSGPDRELDHLVHGTLVESVGQKAYNLNDDGTRGSFIGADRTAPEYTTSLDAVIALTERVLPGAMWGVHCHNGAYRAHVTRASPIRPIPNIADAPTPALALIAAVIQAEIAKQEKEGA